MLCGSLSRLNCRFVTIGGLPMVPLVPTAVIGKLLDDQNNFTDFDPGL
jgi:hypothetical protein